MKSLDYEFYCFTIQADHCLNNIKEVLRKRGFHFAGTRRKRSKLLLNAAKSFCIEIVEKSVVFDKFTAKVDF